MFSKLPTNPLYADQLRQLEETLQGAFTTAREANEERVPVTMQEAQSDIAKRSPTQRRLNLAARQGNPAAIDSSLLPHNRNPFSMVSPTGMNKDKHAQAKPSPIASRLAVTGRDRKRVE